MEKQVRLHLQNSLCLPFFLRKDALMETILVTGGAGYIGSHTSRQLVDTGYRVVVIDNLYSGHRWAVPAKARFIEGDCGDIGLVRKTLKAHAVSAIIHFAGHIVVPESVENPLKYYRNNTCTSRNLIEACILEGVNRFIFSSTAAVYGIPTSNPIAETAPTIPINPYGTSKMMVEAILKDVATSSNGIQSDKNTRFNYVALRYFNVAGASLDSRIGQATPEATHLIKVACETACGLRDKMSVFGTDYDTPDGTGVRDYIHVVDLANAHVAALGYLRGGGPSAVLNCGYGRGFSVHEVIEMVKQVSGKSFYVQEAPRRPGDPPQLIADPTKLHQTFDWTPEYDDLEGICKTAYQWEVKYHRDRYGQ